MPASLDHQEKNLENHVEGSEQAKPGHVPQPLPGAGVPFVDVANITEYGLTQKLSNCIRCF